MTLWKAARRRRRARLRSTALPNFRPRPNASWGRAVGTGTKVIRTGPLRTRVPRARSSLNVLRLRTRQITHSGGGGPWPAVPAGRLAHLGWRSGPGTRAYGLASGCWAGTYASPAALPRAGRASDEIGRRTPGRPAAGVPRLGGATPGWPAPGPPERARKRVRPGAWYRVHQAGAQPFGKIVPAVPGTHTFSTRGVGGGPSRCYGRSAPAPELRSGGDQGKCRQNPPPDGRLGLVEKAVGLGEKPLVETPC